MSWASDDGGEDGPGGIVSGETGFAHTGSIVYNQSGNIIITHVEFFGVSSVNKSYYWYGLTLLCLQRTGDRTQQSIAFIHPAYDFRELQLSR